MYSIRIREQEAGLGVSARIGVSDKQIIPCIEWNPRGYWEPIYGTDTYTIDACFDYVKAFFSGNYLEVKTEYEDWVSKGKPKG